jgi:hypothetical protein
MDAENDEVVAAVAATSAEQMETARARGRAVYEALQQADPDSGFDGIIEALRAAGLPTEALERNEALRERIAAQGGALEVGALSCTACILLLSATIGAIIVAPIVIGILVAPEVAAACVAALEAAGTAVMVSTAALAGAVIGLAVEEAAERICQAVQVC